MIEGLAKRIGYNKVTAFTASSDGRQVSDFVRKTGMKVKTLIAPDVLAKNEIQGVPVTLIETTDGRKLRFDGMTQTFVGQPASPSQSAQPMPQNSQGGQQCGK